MLHGGMNATAVTGSELHHLLLALLETTHSRLWITQFILDARPDFDDGRLVRTLMHAIAETAYRGVDVRVLIPDVSAPSGPEYDVNYPAAMFLANRGVDVRRYRPTKQRPHLHSKVTILDADVAVIGNANWTPGAFSQNFEVSVAVRSPQTVRTLDGWFSRLWAQSERAFPTRIHSAPQYYPSDRSPNNGSTRRRMAELRVRARLLAQFDPALSVDLLSGQRYVRRVEELVRAAKSRVIVMMLGLMANQNRRLHRLLDGLIDAHRRGVDVRVLGDAREGAAKDWMSDAEILSEAGVAVLRWSGTRFHSRTVVIDDTAVVGSVGWTVQSVMNSEEVSIQLSSGHAANEICRLLNVVWKAHQLPATETGHGSV